MSERGRHHSKPRDGVQYDSFQHAGEALHLMANDRDSINCMEEATHYRMPAALRRLYVTLSINNNVNSRNLWDRLTDEPKQVPTDEYRRWKGRCFMSYRLSFKVAWQFVCYAGLTDFGNENIINEVCDLGDEDESKLANGDTIHFNEYSLNQQRLFYDEITNAINSYMNGERETPKV